MHYIYLYFNSKNFRLAANKSLAPIINRRSDVIAVWKWLQKYANCGQVVQDGYAISQDDICY
jgi:hypothetical protein